MKKFFSVVAAFFMLTSVCIHAQTVTIPHINPPAASETIEKGLDLRSIDNIILTISKESAYNPPVAKLCNGAITGIRDYLKSKRLYKTHIPFNSSSLSPEKAIEAFNNTYGKIKSQYPKADPEQISYAAVRGALKQIGDNYAQFMTPKEYKALMDQMKGGNFGGIGVYVELDDKNKLIRVINPIENSPAEKAGIKKGDEIIKINGVPIKDMENVAKANEKLRGEPGSEVTITVKRGKLQPFDVTLTRDIIKTHSVSYKMLDNKIGYIRIALFAERTGEEMRDAVSALEREGARGFILDVRGNGGGYVTSAIQTVSLFVPTGSNVVTLVKEGAGDIPYTSLPNVRYGLSIPMAVLIDKGSASASEITAGALQDYKKGILVGVTSYGKASVQKIYPLQNSTAMKFTTSHYMTPKKRLIDKVGIEPDVVSKFSESKPIRSEKDDVQLQKAIELVSEKISSDKSGDGFSMSSAIKSPSFSNDLTQISEMFPNGYEIVNSELILSEDILYERFTIKTDGVERDVYFTRGSVFEK